MPTDLTSSSIASTYGQLLHVDGGITSVEKIVHDGDGTATPLKLSSGYVGVDNIKLDGNTISVVDNDGFLTLQGNGSGGVNIPKANIVGGQISGITDLAIGDGGTGASTAADARANLGLGSMAVQNANSVNITGGTISGVSLNGTLGKAYGQFISTANQSAAANTPTPVTFNSSSSYNTGVSVVSNSRITFTETGIYLSTVSLQFLNAENSEHDVTVWFSVNGTDLANSASRVTVPKSSVGGAALLEISVSEQITTGQYLEVVWATEDADVRIEAIAAQASPFVCPAIPSAIFNVHRID